MRLRRVVRLRWRGRLRSMVPLRVWCGSGALCDSDGVVGSGVWCRFECGAAPARCATPIAWSAPARCATPMAWSAPEYGAGPSGDAGSDGVERLRWRGRPRQCGAAPSVVRLRRVVRLRWRGRLRSMVRVRAAMRALTASSDSDGVVGPASVVPLRVWCGSGALCDSDGVVGSGVWCGSGCRLQRRQRARANGLASSTFVAMHFGAAAATLTWVAGGMDAFRQAERCASPVGRGRRRYRMAMVTPVWVGTPPTETTTG